MLCKMWSSTFLDETGKPSFNKLQNYGSHVPLHFFIFDLLILKGKDVMGEPLSKRRSFWKNTSFPILTSPYVIRRYYRGA